MRLEGREEMVVVRLQDTCDLKRIGEELFESHEQKMYGKKQEM